MSFVSTFSVLDAMDEAAARLNEVSADEAPNYLTWINLCTTDIARTYPDAPFFYLSANKTLSAGTRHYNHFTDADAIIDITDPTHQIKLKYLPENEFDMAVPSATETGVPTIFTLHGADNSLQFEYYPIPGSSITMNIKYRQQQATVSATSASLPVPQKYAELYPLFVQVKGLERREDYEQANAKKVEYEAMKTKMIEDFNRMTEEPWEIKSIREFQKARQAFPDTITRYFWGDN